MNFLYPILTLSFAYPLALLFPVAIAFLLLVRKKESQALTYPDTSLLAGAPRSIRVRLRGPILAALSTLILILLSLAAARPQRVSVIPENLRARNIVLALDISRSMEARDFQSNSGILSRLAAVKLVVTEFIKSRPNDRIGLVVFGSTAYLQAPLTMDHEVLAQLVSKVDTGVAGDGTAMGDGLGLAVKRAQEISGPAKSVILITDGVSNSGQINPIQAAKVARDLKIKVHTIGIGSDRPVTIRLPGGFLGQQRVSQAEFDEKTLREVAETTGGTYFNAQNLEALKNVSKEIDRLESTVSKEPIKRQVEELFPLYCSVAAALMFLYFIFAYLFWMKLP